MNFSTISKAFFVLGMFAFLSSCTEETPVTEEVQNGVEVERVFRPFLHHFSSTGCGPCGRFGIPLLNEIGDEMGDSIFPFITHFKYNDPFITASSEAIEAAVLSAWYSPQIWVDNENITFDIISDGVPLAKTKTKALLREDRGQVAEAYIGFKATKNDGGRFNIELAVENNNADTSEFYVEVYGMEDGLIASQAGADPYVSTHYRVNRGGMFGEMGKQLIIASKELYTETTEFIPCFNCNADNTYFNVIVWKKIANDKYAYVNGKVYKP